MYELLTCVVSLQLHHARDLCDIHVVQYSRSENMHVETKYIFMFGSIGECSHLADAVLCNFGVHIAK